MVGYFLEKRPKLSLVCPFFMVTSIANCLVPSLRGLVLMLRVLGLVLGGLITSCEVQSSSPVGYD